jgi:two-component system, NtrC family, sensor kinase
MNDPDRKSSPSSLPRQSDLRDLEPAPSGRRPAATELPDWTSELLALSVALPIEEGPRAVAKLAVETLARLLPERAVGLCVADPDGDDQIVETALPRAARPDPVHDPSRLFPHLDHERALPLEADLQGSTLHVARASEPVLSGSEHEPELVELALQVLSAALRRARAFAAATNTNRELRRLQAQVIQSEKLASLGQIVAGVVHELNNPLTSIVAYSDYLKKQAIERGADPDDVERLRRITEAAERILKFSRDLVAYARPATDLPGPVFLHEIIDRALVFCEHEFSGGAIAVERRVREDLPPVRGVSGQLTQVFVNLFTNASHAMSLRGGRLVVEAQPGPGLDSVMVMVGDDGVGIEPADMAHIFEPFFTTKTDGRGTGLGLSIVRDIVDAHGGFLACESTPGKGSSFTLTLPVLVTRKSTRPPPPPSSSTP